MLENESFPSYKPTQKVVWLGSLPRIEYFTKSKKGRVFEKAQLTFHSKNDFLELEVDQPIGNWLFNFVKNIQSQEKRMLTYQQVKNSFEDETEQDIEPFMFSKQGEKLRNFGLLIV